MRLNKLLQGHGIRFIMAMAVLVYVLVPQTGFCSCADCNCSRKLPKSPKLTETTGCCCCQKQAKSCCDAETTKSEMSSESSCRCSCSNTKDNPPPLQQTTVHTLKVWEDLKDHYTVPVAILSVSEAFEFSLPLGKFFEIPCFALPVRLHLLFSVLLN